MAADSSLLQLEEIASDTAAPAAAAAAACCLKTPSSPNSSSNSSNKSSSNSSNRRSSGSPVSTQKAAREAAIAAAAQAASLSERCRSLLPFLKESAACPSSVTKEADARGKHTNPGCKSSSSSRVLTKGVEGPQAAEFLELESDGEGPMIELEVGVGVLDVKGQVPDDARLAELGVQVVDLPEDSPVLQNTALATSSQLDALQRALAARGAANHKGGRPLVSVLSSGSSSEDESDSDVSPQD
ncbi:hypothetical protein Esti_006381 [Eimeria stiedai]